MNPEDRHAKRGWHKKVSEVVEMGEARLERAVSRGYRNWKTQFGEDFGRATKLSDLSPETLAFLTRGGDRSTFYLFDLIMSIQNLPISELLEHDHWPADANEQAIGKVVEQLLNLFHINRKKMQYLEENGSNASKAPEARAHNIGLAVHLLNKAILEGRKESP